MSNLPTGAGESGKSTILKQMKLIHEGGYSRDERESFKEIIFSNTVQSMRVILEAMESLELPLDVSVHRRFPLRDLDSDLATRLLEPLSSAAYPNLPRFRRHLHLY